MFKSRFGLGLVSGLALAACSETEVNPVASFAEPSGLAVAGTTERRLFVANGAEDTAQVLRLGEELNDTSFVYGPAQGFPLRIPAGRGPAALAATLDGRFVVVLDLISESLRLIDADALLLVRDDAGAVVEMTLGDLGTFPTDMVASPVACAAPCVGRVFVSLTGLGGVMAVDVIATDSRTYLEASAVYYVGGQPLRLAINPNGTALAATDGAAPEVIWLDLATGAVERHDIGGYGYPVAVSRDGQAIVVGRPQFRDVVVLARDPVLGWWDVDADAAFAPIPSCVASCDNPDPWEDVCVSPHPADKSLCESESGLSARTGNTYGAIYLGEAPTQIVTLGVSAGEPELSVPCEETGRTFAEFAAVAVLDGTVRLVALKDTADGPVNPVLVETGWCKTPELSASVVDTASGSEAAEEIAAATFLTPCAQIPEGRQRFQCVTDGEGETPGGVVVSPGNTGSVTWQLKWEGVLTGLNRVADDEGGVAGAGTINEDGTFTDLVVDLGDYAIRSCTLVPPAEGRCQASTPADQIAYRGDILVIRSEPIGSCVADPCREGEGLDWRVFERRIVAVEEVEGGPSRLVLDRPLVAESICFRQEGVIEYRIRAGEQFVAASSDGEVDRVAPGEQLGPGGAVGRRRSVLFGVRDLDPRGDLTACQRYESTGTPKLDANGEASVLDPALSRTITHYVSINDNYWVFRSGLGLDAGGNVTGVAGRIPSTMIVSAWGAEAPAIFIGYSGSNSLLGFVPFDLADPFGDPGRYQIMQ